MSWFEDLMSKNDRNKTAEIERRKKVGIDRLVEKVRARIEQAANNGEMFGRVLGVGFYKHEVPPGYTNSQLWEAIRKEVPQIEYSYHTYDGSVGSIGFRLKRV